MGAIKQYCSMLAWKSLIFRPPKKMNRLMKQGKPEGFDSCDRHSNLTQIGFKIVDFSARVTLKFDGWPRKIIVHLFYITSSFNLCITSNPSVNSNWSYSPETLDTGGNRQFFVPHDLEKWWMTLKNNRATLLCYVKFCSSFQSHRWIQT